MTHSVGSSDLDSQGLFPSRVVRTDQAGSGIQLVARPKHPKDESQRRQRIRTSPVISHSAEAPCVTLTYRQAGGPLVAQYHILCMSISIFACLYAQERPRS